MHIRTSTMGSSHMPFACAALAMLLSLVASLSVPTVCAASTTVHACSSSTATDVCKQPPSNGSYVPKPGIPDADAETIKVALNLEYLEAEFFLFGATGFGLDHFAPDLAAGGPPPSGGQKAKLDPLTQDIIYQFGLQEVGHLRAIKTTIGPSAFPRVPLDISPAVFKKTMEAALGMSLPSSFNIYDNSLSYLLASYVIPYVGLTGYVGANPQLSSARAKRLVAGLLGVEAGQDAVIRTLLYQLKDEQVLPGVTCAQITDKISDLRNKLGQTGIVDEGLVVPQCLGAEGKVASNTLSADQNSVAYARTPEQIFRVVYSTGDASKPGGFYPQGCRGVIAEQLLKGHH